MRHFSYQPPVEPTPETRVCETCHTERPLAGFYHGGRRRHCKFCESSARLTSSRYTRNHAKNVYRNEDQASALARIALTNGLETRWNEAEVLSALLERHPEPVPAMQLCYLINPHRPLTLGALYERVRILKKRSGDLLVSEKGADDIWRYRLTAQGLDACRAAYGKAIEQLTSVRDQIADPKRADRLERPAEPERQRT